MPPDDHDDNFQSSDNVVALPSNEDAAVIERLAALDSLQYDRERKKAAEKLGVREQTLDRKVKEARTGSGAKQGREMILPEPDPWDEQVDGDALLDDLRAGLCRAIPAVNYIKSGFRL